MAYYLSNGRSSSLLFSALKKSLVDFRFLIQPKEWWHKTWKCELMCPEMLKHNGVGSSKKLPQILPQKYYPENITPE